jgi:hypothetical protein
MAKKRRRPAKKQGAGSTAQATVKPKPRAAKPKSEAPKVPAARAPQTQSINPGEYAYVGREVRQILLITAFFVALQVGLWLAMGQTGLADRLTKLISI